MKRESKSPWVLKYDGKPVNLDLTVGVLNTFGNNVVVLEAENTPVNQAPASPYPPVRAGNPLSPKDPNPRLPPTAVPSKPTIPSNHDKNGVSTPNPTPEDIGPDPKRAPNTQHNPFPTYSPKPNRSPLPMPVPPHTLPLSTSHNAQHGGTSLVKVELGQFPEYCAAHIDRYRTVFPGETDGSSTAL